MPSAATLLVLVVAAGDGDPLPGALDRAARQTLGVAASIVVRRVDALPSDAQAAAMGDAAHAAAIAEVAWSDAEHRHARLHVRAGAEAPWIDREIGFASTDAPAEQGRTIGFALASMLPDASSSAPTQPASTLVGGGVMGSASSVATPEGTPAPPEHAEVRGDLEAVGFAAQAFGGYGGGIGGGIAGDWYVVPRFVIRAGGTVRVAEVAPAAATSFVGTFGAGIGWRPIEAERPWSFGLGLRVDALAIVQSLTHYDTDDQAPDRHSRWLPGADALLEGTWLFTSSGAIVVAGGVEAAFGSTDIYLNARTVTELPPLRGLVAVGIRARF
jgi:hypothetical protein